MAELMKPIRAIIAAEFVEDELFSLMVHLAYRIVFLIEI